MIASNRTIYITFACLILLTSILACNAPGAGMKQVSIPSTTVESSVEALDSFNNKWRSLNLATPDGPFSMTFTEAELTSAVVQALDNAEAEQGSSIPVEDVYVLLADGKIQCYARARLDPLDVNGYIAFLPSIGDDGQIHLDIVDFQFGPLQIDDAELANLVSTVEYSINEPIQASPFTIVLQQIYIQEGELVIEGSISP
ncbi:MAG: hypothetical protein JXJ17_02015 [Anaerolineae bacterium]|nr:hypothetical protein [Anaerolineae bacterium]